MHATVNQLSDKILIAKWGIDAQRLSVDFLGIQCQSPIHILHPFSAISLNLM